ncbi:hypothetical protein SJA_C1-01350 [Sphingobium indicum UT26S]|uniref:Uncharacterized protein n=1 Tax=Sphingobium indicum (strain DSM 16413 / CCM 7287 / MTCC 6362 / UT26 / NBRC 101211 / UT26S) TaxID=452662 RepID=D4YX87_SPHIU|nr:hypothetical protein SJA_C1-01350 [Sphingobium indicum UT26S]
MAILSDRQRQCRRSVLGRIDISEDVEPKMPAFREPERSVARQRGQIRKCREMANFGHCPTVTPDLIRGPAFLSECPPCPRQRDPGSSPG